MGVGYLGRKYPVNCLEHPIQNRHISLLSVIFAPDILAARTKGRNYNILCFDQQPGPASDLVGCPGHSSGLRELPPQLGPPVPTVTAGKDLTIVATGHNQVWIRWMGGKCPHWSVGHYRQGQVLPRSYPCLSSAG